jgi:signal recognition particle subunit SRP54
VKIIDTAGRHALEEDLIEEMKRIRELTNPDQRLLVIDASLGQTASEHAKAFDDAIGITGVIVTKLDGTAKGGGALSAVSQAGCPITFTGTGETMDDLESFEPDGFISLLLGMGDVKALIERAESLELKEEEMESMISGKFTLKDLYKQLEMIKKLGPLKQVMNLLPFGSMGIDLSDDAYQLTGEKLNSYRVIMDSMTDEELERPGLMSGSRIRRVSIGSGKSPEEVRELLKYHKMVKRAMKGMRGNKIPMKKIMGKFKI